jgi:hypothetical protein
MNTKRFGAAFVALLSMFATPTVTSAQSAPATGAAALAQITPASEHAAVVPMRGASPNAASTAGPISTAASISSSRKRVAGHRIFMPMRGASPNAAASTNPNNIPYLGGAVFPHPLVYAFWWGNPTDFPLDTHDGINHFFRALDGSAYMDLPNQYLFGKEANIHFGGNVYDYSAPPAQDPPTTEIVAEVCSVLQAHGMKPDPTALYAVYTSNFPPQNVYCAFHDIGACPDGTMMHVMFMPNAENLSACWVQPPELSCNSKSNGLQAAANSTAHELMESITDPNIDAWVNIPAGYNEIGDPCNFLYKRCVNLSDGSKWQLQMIWSDKVEACRQGSGVADD